MYNTELESSNPVRDIGSLPVTMLYDFANAFPSLCHQWVFKVLNTLGIPVFYIKCIENLYRHINAFSSGVGTESFLFKVERGVKTGCPLSSVLFLLAINPFVFLFQWLSDGPSLSTTRVCADDFGSALQKLSVLRIQHSIFNLAAPVAGLHLKPRKCVLIVSCVVLTQEIINAIRVWLRNNVPSFQDIDIASSGKYLGW